MKKTVIALLAFILLLTIIFTAGCKDSFLDTPNPNQQTEKNAWKTEADVLAAIASVYSPLRVPLYGYWGAFVGVQDINAMGDDILTIPGEEAATWQVASFTFDAKNVDIESIFANMYRSISRANLVIENAPKVPNIDAAALKSYIAEVKFLRGLCYFTLASNFGDVPLKTAVPQSAKDSFVPSAPVTEVYNQAMKDLSEAAANLPVKRTSDDEMGRATKGAAIAFLGKLHLYTKDFPKAETTLAQLFSSPFSYGLVDNFEDNFTDKNEFNKESILEWVYGSYGDPYDPWSEEMPNAGMYNYRPQLFGPPAGGGWFKYIPSDFVIKEFKKELRPAGSDTKFDKRMYASFLWKYSDFGEKDTTWYDKLTFETLWSSAEKKINRFPENYKKFPEGKFLIKKFTSAWRNVAKADNYWGATPSTANVEVMRFAEVLLMHAEAAAENNNLSGAIASINQVRKRAGIMPKTATELSSKTAIMAEISHQKLLELFFEQNRWHDLKRWYPNASALKTYLISVNKQGAKNIRPKHYIFPIPTAEVQTNNNLEQNSLWK